ncbi:MAG: hypothetical protein AAFY01_11470 [Pseudomonadota bacterium]
MRSHSPQSFDFDEDPENVWPKTAVEAADQMRDVLALFIRISEEFDMSTTADMLRHTVETARQDALSKSGVPPHHRG